MLKEVVASGEGQRFVNAPCSYLRRNEDRESILEEILGIEKGQMGEVEGGEGRERGDDIHQMYIHDLICY